MERKERSRLGEHELSVMHIFWDRGETRHEKLEEAVQAIGYGRDEAAEIVRKLVERGVLEHREEESTYVYSPLISKREVETLMLEDIVQNVYQGSREALLQGLVNHGIFSKEELIQAAGNVKPAAERS